MDGWPLLSPPRRAVCSVFTLGTSSLLLLGRVDRTRKHYHSIEHNILWPLHHIHHPAGFKQNRCHVLRYSDGRAKYSDRGASGNSIPSILLLQNCLIKINPELSLFRYHGSGQKSSSSPAGHVVSLVVIPPRAQLIKYTVNYNPVVPVSSRLFLAFGG